MTEHERAGYVILTLTFRKEGRLWVGQCEELGTATDGRSLEKVERELERLIAVHLEGLEAIGEREHIFRERGIHLYRGHPPTEVERSVPVSTDDTLVQFKCMRVGTQQHDPVGV